MLFEIYQRFGSVTADATTAAPHARAADPRSHRPDPAGAGAALLVAHAPTPAQPRASARRLLSNAVTSSRRERQRVASYLHDGPVQELAGLAFSLAPLADGAERRRLACGGRGVAKRGRPAPEHDPRPACAARRPPPAEPGRRRPRLGDPRPRQPALRSRDEGGVDDRRRGSSRPRNAGDPLPGRAGGGAETSSRTQTRGRSRSRSMSPSPMRALWSQTTAPASRRRSREQRLSEGHLGLALLEELARQAGGRLTVDSTAGAGTRIELEVPLEMIRVVVADDHGVLRDGLAGVIAAQPDLEVVATAVERRRGGRGLSELLTRCRADGSRDAAARRYRGDAGDSRGPARHRRPCTHLVLGRSPDHRRRSQPVPSGYLLKDASADDVVRGIRAAAGGGAPLDPQAARLLLDAKNAPDPIEGISPSERDVFALLLDGLPEQGDRATARHQREDGEDAPDQHLPPDRRDGSRAGDPLGRATGTSP